MSVVPFAGLLLLIAIGPLFFQHWWEQHYPKISIGLGLLVAAWLVLTQDRGTWAVLETLVEYLSFVALIGSLFVVSGGIHIHFEGRASAGANTLLLGVGGVLANLVGTTGASMLLIRPFLRFNRGRLEPYQVVFFIFLVSNIGGALTPIGDPPLFLGYLKGVPFFWMVENAILPWLLTMGVLLAAFHVLDRRRGGFEATSGPASLGMVVRGGGQIILLVCILGLVLGQKAPVLHHFRHEFVSLAVAVAMIVVATISHYTADKTIHEDNGFDFHPLKEVGFLFFGIFLTMIPALASLREHATTLGVDHAWQFYLGCGVLSSTLDNAPTYLTFLSLALGRIGLGFLDNDAVKTLLATPEGTAIVEAISLGAVFWGAVTYIGNGPNFMVRNIAKAMGAPTPDFLEYIWRYSVPFLLPLLLVVGLLFGIGLIQ